MVSSDSRGQYGDLGGRVRSLWAWLRRARDRFPTARFVAKLDDDVYMVAPEWAAQLRLIAATLPPPRAIFYGFLAWHVWNTAHFVPHSFDFSYNPPATGFRLSGRGSRRACGSARASASGAPARASARARSPSPRAG